MRYFTHLETPCPSRMVEEIRLHWPCGQMLRILPRVPPCCKEITSYEFFARRYVDLMRISIGRMRMPLEWPTKCRRILACCQAVGSTAGGTWCKVAPAEALDWEKVRT